MNAKQALELIEPIPAEDFIANHYTDNKSKCCVIGHLERLSKDPANYSDENCKDEGKNNPIRILSTDYLIKKHGEYTDIASVNNQNKINGYNEPKIKDRVVHLLKDMIDAGY